MLNNSSFSGGAISLDFQDVPVEQGTAKLSPRSTVLTLG